MFKTILRQVGIFLFVTIEKLKGSKELILLPPVDDDFTTVTVKTFFGYTVEIKVRRRVFRCVYKSKWYKQNDYITFEVNAELSDDAPIAIKKAFSKTYTFPKMIPKYIPVKYHMERAVNSYMDMIICDNIKDKDV